MTRLTNEIRDKIINNAVTKAIGDRETVQLKALGEKFSQKLVETACGENYETLQKIDQEIQKIIEKIPERFKQYEDVSHVNKDRAVRLNLAGQSVDWFFEDEKIFPYTSYRDRYVIPQGHELLKLMDDYRSEEKAIDDIKSNVRENVKALVYSVTTVKKLLEVWPESLELIPTDVAKPVVNLPSIKIEQLNALIGVPSDN